LDGGVGGWMNSFERKIFSRLGESKPDLHHQKQVQQLLSQGVDVDHLIETALNEGIAGLLYKYLLEAELLHTLSVEYKKKLERIYYQILYSNLKLTHALKTVLHQLNQNNIQVVLLQGIGLIQQVYGDLGLRPMTDIDFWVLPKDYSGLIPILISQGFERNPLYPNTFRKDSIIFDIHTHILWADRIPARKLLIRKGEEDIYRKTGMIDIEGQSARCLNPYDHVIYLSLHVLKHYANRLIWLVDIKSILVHWDETDWVSFMNRAKELGQERTVAYVFFLLSLLLDFHPPPDARRSLQRHKLSVLEKKILSKRIDQESLPIWAPVFLFASGMAFKNRLQFTIQSIFPNPEILRQVFASSSDLKVWELYGKRILQVFGQK
jgi:hypothetical protein